MKRVLLACIFFVFTSNSIIAQIDEDQLGAWYMYFWNTKLPDKPWGLQGDVQYRNWDLGGDLEQLLIRNGLTYTITNNIVRLTRLCIHPDGDIWR